jgi:hypothetical protein
MEVARYKPSESLRWLEIYAEQNKSSARKQGDCAVLGPEQTISERVKTMSGVLYTMGKGAAANLAHFQAQKGEYDLYQTKLELRTVAGSKIVEYSEVRGIDMKGDRATIRLAKGCIVIKPYAYITAGPIKAPIGWTRNGIDAPFELLVEELVARSGIKPDFR